MTQSRWKSLFDKLLDQNYFCASSTETLTGCCFSGWVRDCGSQSMFTVQKISLRSLCSASLVHYRAVKTPTASLFTRLSFGATSHFYIIHKTTFIVIFWHPCRQFGFYFHVEISTEISSFLLYTVNVRGKFNLWCSQDLRDWDNPQNTLSTFFFIESTSCRSPWGNLLVFHFHEIWASRACRWRVVSKSMWQQFWVEADATWNEPAASVLVPRQADVSTEPR